MLTTIKTKNVKPIWCPGCGLYVIQHSLVKAFEELGWTQKDTVIVSGIGCTGRVAGYLDLDSVHTTHGRAIPVAEGIKLANPKLNVIVVSGDGDLLGIGLNHLIHTARRNTNIIVVCNSNQIYGMTGGQMSPQTPIGVVTLTTPEGSPYEPVNVQKLMESNKKYHYARTAVFDPAHLKKSIVEAAKYEGFAFVDVVSACYTNSGRRQGFKNIGEMFGKIKKSFEYQKDENVLEENQLGVLEV